MTPLTCMQVALVFRHWAHSAASFPTQKAEWLGVSNTLKVFGDAPVPAAFYETWEPSLIEKDYIRYFTDPK